MLRMDQVHVIRHKVLVEGLSIRKTAKDLGVSRNTVRRYLKLTEPIREEPRHELFRTRHLGFPGAPLQLDSPDL